ncbi:MAG TPA: type II secretion system F family protein [Verrucomicrobiae bacterium]|jgi:type II secretory pathway component PulF|nr:type II secretion system F family protein [Verrucomicrobiae bacterium]
MAVFQYKALQTDGKTAVGELEAGGRQEAFRQMEERGLKPISLSEKSGGAVAKPARNGLAAPAAAPAPSAASKPLFQSRKVSPRMLENFTRLLSSLLAAGVPLSRALVILCKEAASPAAAEQWKQVHSSVIDGVSLADSMAQSPDTFPRVYVAMVEAGETGGFLDLVLAQIADFQAREKDLRGKVTTAMIYPVILLCMTFAVLIFLMVFFIPRFQTIFVSFGAQLPLLTRGIIAVSRVMIHYGVWMAAAVAIGVFLIRGWIVSEKGRRSWEGIVLRSPIVGPLMAQFAMARFCRMLGTLLGAGVPLVQSLNVARKSIGNQILVDAVSNAIDRVKEGGQLGKSLAECSNLFSSSVVEMIAVAEESGRLDQELVRIALVTESDLDRNLKTAVSIAEPLILFFMATVIGTIFIGMLVPIFTLSSHIK